MVNIFQSILFLLGSGDPAIWKEGIIWGMDLPAFSCRSGHGYRSPTQTRHFFPISGFNFLFFWPCSPPGTETTMIQHRRAPGEPPGPPAGDTHHTAGTTAVSKVGMEPSCFLSWQVVPNALGDRLLSF